MSTNRCDAVIGSRGIKTNNNECKQTNTFILSTTNPINAICGRAGEPYNGGLTKSLQPFSIIVCTLRNQVRPPRCEYRGQARTRKIAIAYALISVTSFGLGEAGTLTCPLPDFEYSNTRVKWYKQSVGDTLVLITTLMKGATNPKFEKAFPSSRFEANFNVTTCSLTILKTVPEDEAVFHCAISTWNEDHWTGTYLSLKGNAERKTDVTVAQWPTVSHSAEDSITLRCSVLSDSQETTCPSEHSVHLIGVRSDESHANIMYTDGNRRDKCDNKSEVHSAPKTCIYHFSKNARSSDHGTFYCAVATCGEVLSDNGTKLDGTSLWSLELKKDAIILCLLCAVLVISVTVMALLIYGIKKHKCEYCNEAGNDRGVTSL
ncbi:uncharacterized protein LKV04_005381 [Tautogolabrus adspersus]